LPSLILLDLMMPVMDGYEFYGHLQANAEWATIPVVVVTAIAEQLKADSPLAAAPHLQKPVMVQQLLALVAHTIRHGVCRDRSATVVRSCPRAVTARRAVAQPSPSVAYRLTQRS
jgi:CheY-like chemotaxis protein